MIGICATLLTLLNSGCGEAYNTPVPSKPQAAILSGMTTHNFGTVTLNGENPITSLSHEFVLKNTTENTLQIEGVRSSCGCTVAEVNRESILPGEDIIIHARLSLTSYGTKSSLIRLLLRDQPPITLSISGTGIILEDFFCYQSTVKSSKTETGTVTMGATNYMSEHQPPDPIIESPPEFSTRFLGWQPLTTLRPDLNIPLRWEGKIEIRIESLTPRIPSHLSIRLPGQSRKHFVSIIQP